MAEGVRRQYSAARGALHEATLDKEGFDNVLDPIARLGQASGDRLDPGRADAKRERGRLQIAKVHRIEAHCLDVEETQRYVADASGDFRLVIDGREIANSAQQAPSYAWSPPRAPGDFIGAVFGDGDREHPRVAPHDPFQFFDRVGLESPP